MKYISIVKCMSNNQYLGVIRLLSKNGDLTLLENWRPLTLLNIDYKIYAKILTNRLKNIMSKIISPEQYCAVEGRSIFNCNSIIRGIMYYSKDNNLEMAILNLDWSKAFDRVNIEFVFKVMEKLVVPVDFRNLVGILYKDCKSCVNPLPTSDLI